MRRQFNELSELSCTDLHLQDGVWWRKGWDSNPRYRRIGTPDFESGAFDHSATSPGSIRLRRVVAEPGILAQAQAVNTDCPPM